MKTILALTSIFLSAFINPSQNKYLFISLRPIPACDGKCNNFELTEYFRNSAEACKSVEDSLKAIYKDKTTYYTVAPGEAVIYYKYNKFVAYCDCKILGVHKSSSVEQAKLEMDKTVEEARAKNPKAYHNYEVYKTWP